MGTIDKFPKSIKKTVRYIKQEATREQLEEIKKIIDNAIQRRNVTLD
jgi:aminoglycoside phosphotransferase family enzyme